MKKLIVAVLLAVFLTGCSCLGESDEMLLREIRKDLDESVRPALVDAMHKAKTTDGKPAYIEPYKDEKARLVDTMINAIDRVYPNKDKNGKTIMYVPKPLPWKTN